MPFINYTELNIFTVNAAEPRPKLANGKEDADAICKSYSMQFVPGINEVTQEELAVISLHAGFNAFVESGKLVILEDPKGKDGQRPVREMLSLISKMYDVKLLKKVITTDGRAEVIEAARAQLEVISSPVKGEPKGTDEHFK